MMKMLGNRKNVFLTKGKAKHTQLGEILHLLNTSHKGPKRESTVQLSNMPLWKNFMSHKTVTLYYL